MKFVLSVRVVTSATLLLTACGGDGGDGITNGATNGGSPATNIALVSGDAQTGGRTTDLANPLVVVVTDAQGNGVSGVNVTWTTTGAGGAFTATATQTDAQGRASVVYTLGTLPGQSTISATAGTLTGSPVTFTTTATDLGPITVTVEMSGIQFQAPGGGTTVTVLLRDAIEWVNRDGFAHTVTSSSAPAGGATFASALLATGETATFTPGMVGTWVYFCTEHPLSMVGAQIIVQ